jgi:hypothetical protein
VHTAGALRALLLIAQDQAILAERRFAELGGSAPIGWSPMLTGVARTRLGLGGETSKWQVCAQALSEGSHRDPPMRGGHDLSPGGDSHRQLWSHSAAHKRGREQGRRRARLDSYRAAVSFNQD